MRTPGTEPKALLISRDAKVRELMVRTARPPWQVENWDDAASSREVLADPLLRIVVFDDEAFPEHERGWFLAQIRRLAHGALVIYVSSSHSEAMERQARTKGVLYYTSKPVDDRQFARVVRSAMDAQMRLMRRD